MSNRFTVTCIADGLGAMSPVDQLSYPDLAGALDAARRHSAVAPEDPAAGVAWVISDRDDASFWCEIRHDVEVERRGTVDPVPSPGASLITRRRSEHGGWASLEWRRFLGERELADVAAATSARVAAHGGQETPAEDPGDDHRIWLVEGGIQIEVTVDPRGASIAGYVFAPQVEDPAGIPALAAIVGRAVARGTSLA